MNTNTNSSNQDGVVVQHQNGESGSFNVIQKIKESMQEEAKRFSDTTTATHDESQSSNNSQGNDPNKSRDFY